MSIIIYGASDDLIEAEEFIDGKPQGSEGRVYEEWSYDEEDELPTSTIVVISEGGGIIEVKPILGDTWTAEVKVIRPGPRGQEIIYSFVLRPDGPSEEGDMGVEVHAYNPVVYKTVKS